MEYLRYLKYVTALLGFLLFGKSIPGAILGFFIGMYISFKLSGGLLGKLSGFGNVGSHAGLKTGRQAVFFKTVFTLMGKLAKADGRVSEVEIAHIEEFMAQLGMNPENRKEAIAFFKNGSGSDFEIEPLLQEFNEATRLSPNLRQMMMVYLVRVALADGALHPNESGLLRDIATTIGFSEQAFEQLISMLQGQDQFAGGYYQQGGSQSSGAGGYTSPNALDAAYQALGVNKDDSDAEIKKAYRRLIREYHPDKLIGQGLPEAMIKEATERSKEIQAAYDLIKKSREG